MLHRNSVHPKVKEAVCKGLKPKEILALLLLSSKFETKLKGVLDTLISSK